MKFQAGKLHRRVPGTMTKLEQKYAAELAGMQRAEQIVGYHYESIKLKLADNTFYTPDFAVLFPDGHLELCEVKGTWAAPNQDKSRVKLKVAASLYPFFNFVAITELPKKHGGGWEREEF